MWEESCESISVRHRRASEVRGDGASDSEDEFVLIPEAGQLTFFKMNYDGFLNVWQFR